MSKQNRFSPKSNLWVMGPNHNTESYKRSSIIGEYPGNDIRV